MKKITSKEPISFRVDGKTLLEIGPKGCIASDEAAKIALERLGGNITVVETSIEKAVEDAKDSLNEPSLTELKAEAKDLGLPVSGSKDELTERIAAHKAETPEVPEE